MQNRPLEHLRILDLSDGVGAYCTKLFANLGAEVIMVEPIGGMRLRRQPPFIKNQFGLENSLKYQYLCTDKKSIQLDLSQSDGRYIFKQLIKEADVVIESFHPQEKKRWRIDYGQMKEVNEQVIWCAITPFGQDGPYHEYRADDLIHMSMGGMAYLAGYPDAAPLVMPNEQSYYMASLFAAVSIMIAHHHRKVAQKGLMIDISIQECVAMGTETAPQFYDIKKFIRKRIGEEQREPAMGFYPCADGYVMFYAGELGSGQGWINLVQWLQEEKIPGSEMLTEPQWRDKEWKKTDEAKQMFYDIFVQLTKKYTKQELYLEGQRRKIAVAPLNTPQDVVANEHFQARKFFTTIETREQEKIIGPGAPYQLSESPWRICQGAPKLGEHTQEILHRLGYDNQELLVLFQMGVIG